MCSLWRIAFTSFSSKQKQFLFLHLHLVHSSISTFFFKFLGGSWLRSKNTKTRSTSFGQCCSRSKVRGSSNSNSRYSFKSFVSMFFRISVSSRKSFNIEFEEWNQRQLEGVVMIDFRFCVCGPILHEFTGHMSGTLNPNPNPHLDGVIQLRFFDSCGWLFVEEGSSPWLSCNGEVFLQFNDLHDEENNPSLCDCGVPRAAPPVIAIRNYHDVLHPKALNPLINILMISCCPKGQITYERSRYSTRPSMMSASKLLIGID